MRLLLILLVLFVSSAGYAQEITKKRGTVKFYFDDGKLRSKGKVKNYKRRGEWKYYDQNGKVIAIANYVNDSVHGKYTEYHSQGGLMYDGMYCMNNKCGTWKTFDANGNLISVENFSQGMPDGLQRYWYSNKQMRDSVLYMNGVIQFSYSWYPGGSPKAIATYENGLPEGEWKEYRESFNGDTLLLNRRTYHQGALNGWSYEYYGNNVVRRAEQYRDGRYHGDVIAYNTEGQIYTREKYREGQLDSLLLFEAGKTAMVEVYTNNGNDGMRKEYYRDGNIMKELWFHGPVLDSMHAYHKNGQMAIRQVFRLWRRGFYNEEWDENGHLLVTGYTDTGDRRDSVWTSWYPDGKVRTVAHYQNGAMLGLFTKYYSNGKKMLEMVFLPDGRNTQPDVWYNNGKPVPMNTHYYSEIVQGNRPDEIYNDPANFKRSIINREGNPFDRSGKYTAADDVVNGISVEDAYPGGKKAMDEFIANNLVDPRGPMEDKEGTIYVEYVVGIDGSIGGIRVVKSFSGAGAMEQAAVNVVAEFPLHNPVSVNGGAVRYRMVVPIRFER